MGSTPSILSHRQAGLLLLLLLIIIIISSSIFFKFQAFNKNCHMYGILSPHCYHFTLYCTACAPCTSLTRDSDQHTPADMHASCLLHATASPYPSYCLP